MANELEKFYSTFGARKHFWLREELSPIADELTAAIPALRAEFLAEHPEFLEDNHSRLPSYNGNGAVDITGLVEEETWKSIGIQYKYPQKNFSIDVHDESRIKFPTACALTDKWSDLISCYSIITPNSEIKRHTGYENNANLHIRIHVPLIVPAGDIFLECEGEEIDWSDIFGFDNSLIHSAYNLSPHLRLIYLIDVRRELLGIEPGTPFNPLRRALSPNFVRGQVPKCLHTCQKEIV